jgi:cysteine desulfurase/selenocysteine lyase
VDSMVRRDEYAALERCVYLNQAALGLIPATTVAAMVDFLSGVAQHGNVRLSDDEEAQILDGLRAAAAELLDAPLASVAITGGASEALGQVAGTMGVINGTVVLVSSDFPSVTYPWLLERQRHGTTIRAVDDRPDEDLTISLVRAIDESTQVACFSAVQFATGSAVDVSAVVARAKQVGARVIVDATQLAGAGPASMRDWSADAVVCSGYKWLSSHGGVALLALTPELVAATPRLVGWKGTRDPFQFEPMSLPLAADARRFEMSTIAYVSAVGLRESIGMLSAIGGSATADHARRLATDLVAKVEPPGWSPFRPVSSPAASGHIVALRHPVVPMGRVQRLLADRYGIICGSRSGMLRISLHLYNDTSDVDALVRTLAEVTESADVSG